MALKEELSSIISPECILDDPGTLDAYSGDMSFAKHIKPGLVVKPKKAEDVQPIVNWARKTGTPLVPVSSGPPRFRGDTVPGVPGAVVVDLSGLKRIFKIDYRNRIAMLEAGVTYPELQQALAKEGLMLNMPLLPRPSKSVVASLLEREPTIVPRLQWASLEPLRCTAIIWGDGKQLVTGDAGNWPSMEQAWNKKQAAASPQGPGQQDFYRFVSGAQGSMGIVTWISVKCDYTPAVHKLFYAPAKKLEDLVDFSYKILKFRYADEFFIVNGFTLASIIGKGQSQIKKLAEKLPPWVALVGIAGRNILPRERVDYQQQDIADIAREFGLKLETAVPGAEGVDVLKTITGVSREPYWKLDYKGGFQDIFFLTTLNKTPDFAGVMDSVAGANKYPASEIGVYIQPLQQGSNCHCEFILPYDRDKPQEAAGMQQLFNKASEALLGKGAFYSRPYGPWANLAYSRDAQSTAVLKKIKGIFDPDNIMNPGKLCF
jgi:FAD/FMN-containing dehydrogenase